MMMIRTDNAAPRYGAAIEVAVSVESTNSRADLSAASTMPKGLSKMRTFTMCATSQTMTKIAIAKGIVSALSKGEGSIMASPMPLNKEVESLAAAAEPKTAAIRGT